MKIAIHAKKGSFSDRWIQYCESNDIAYKLVDCYSSDIIEKLHSCDALLWHWHHADPKAILFARQLICSIEAMGKKVFPDSKTCWHFDDKVGQKYLLEAINAPLVPSYVFYDKKEALEWVAKIEFPKVFKLRGGAGSANVKLVNSKRYAQKLIKKAFGKGFGQFNRLGYLKERWREFCIGQDSIWGVLKGFARLAVPTEFAKIAGNEKGYVYFQKFIPNNAYDTRVIVIGDKIFAVRRYCRENDFRASGSGIKGYDPSLFDKRCLEIAWDVSSKLGLQCCSYDFVFDEYNSPLIVEISYGFITGPFYDDCPGYWDRAMEWHHGKFKPQFWIMENILRSIVEDNVVSESEQFKV